MKFKSRFVIFSLTATAISLFSYGRSVALEAAHCAAPKNTNDILKCLQQRHPEVQNEDVINEVSDRLSQQGSSWNNPEISLESVKGENLGRTANTTEVRISQAIEVGGLRAARRNIGKALGDSFKAESLGKLEEVTLLGIKSLYRLTQLNDELEKTEESVQRFRTIKNKYQSRPRLNPDQEITLSLVQLAVSEFEIRLNHLQKEKREILSELSASTGLSATAIEKNLPTFKNEWPETPKVDVENKSASLLKSQADVDLSVGQLAEAKAQAWPEFKVSLIANNNIDGSVQYQTYGMGISMPIPIFNRNRGERALKASQSTKAMKVHKRNLDKQQSILKNLTQQYEVSVKNLKNTPSGRIIESKHKKAESLFAQGLIAGPLIIEAHRQLLSYTQSRNEEELKALEALWTLYILNGTFLNQKL